MPRLTRMLLILPLSAFLAVWHCSGNAQEAGEKAKGLQVQILLFSGRPDPVYQLTHAGRMNRIKSFMKKAKKTKFDEKTIIPSILGYRGIVVENAGGIAGLPEKFAVYKGRIEILGKVKMHRADEGRQLEKLLLKEAAEKKVIDDKIFRRININAVK